MTPLIDDSRAFPAAPPPDLDNPQQITSNDWDAFRAVERMTNHWNRPGWAPGHRAYYWMLAFPEEPELIAQTRSCQQALAGLDMNEVPHDGLHITMNKIGSCADVDPGTVDALAQLADGTLGGGFQIRAEPMAGSTGAIRFSVTPWTPLVELHAALHHAGQLAGVPGGKPSSLFRPHLGILYNNRDRHAAPVIDAVALLRNRPSVALPIERVDLVELRREERTYRWRVLHSLALPGRSPFR
ncbi:2'-5' RNA ligase family protein (plasmid) [Streptomyces sp. NBC_01724]|uniref:2'-5' RNA ligase family protein n=1 Tax=Streptomyces sp. NBC_01724 TaxID=2975922 RepID=UPI002E377279|nr:2'-5' RNA ligase family protein [Streptomyces sp. NBC_01724]